MKIRFFITCFLLSSFSFAQKSKLAGYVSEQNTGKKIAGAMIKSFHANPIETSNSGYFILTFQNMARGTNIIVQAEKNGWELVNEKEMSTLIPENPDEKPFKIVLCKAGMLAIAKSKYYETFELNLQKELDRQKALNKGNAKKIASLEEDFARVQKQLYGLADEYSRIDLSSASEKDLKAIALFKAGKYDEFIKLKNSIVTEVQVDKAIQNKKEASKIIANTDSTIALYFKSQKDIANTLVLQFKFNEAEKVYENIVSKDTSNFVNTFDLAYFLDNQNQQDKAMLYYRRALKLAKPEAETGNVQINLGNLYKAKNDYNAALNAYQKALEIYERLAKTSPATYEPGLAMTQNNLGLFYHDKNDYPAALNAYQKALEISQRLSKTNPTTYEPDVASTQHNLGNLYADKNDYPAALNAYQKALEIRERLTKTNLSTYEPAVAETQNNLGILYQTKNDYPAALNAYQKALEIREQLAKTNPATYEPGVATTQNNLGALYQAKDDYPAALNAYQKALEIRERLAKTNPATYEPYVAETQNNLGLLYRAKNDYHGALKAYQKALEISQQLAKTNPATYEPDVAGTQNNLGNLYADKNDYPAALNAYQKALEIYERLAKTNPATYEPYLALAQNNLGNLYADKNDYPAALNAYQKALEIYERLAKNNPEGYEIIYCRSIVLLGLVQKADYQENRQAPIEKYLGEARQILPRYPDVPLAKSLLDIVNDLESYFKTNKISPEIQGLQTQIAKTENNAEKIKLQEQIVEQYRSLVANGNPKLANELGGSLSTLAWYQLFEKQFSAAEISAKEALNPTRYSKTDDYYANVEWANTNLALALLFQGKYSEAEKIYENFKDKPLNNAAFREVFLADLDELENAGITHPDVAKIRKLLEK